MRRFSLPSLVPDLIALVVALVLGELLDWWDLPDLSLQGGLFVMLFLIWVRLTFGRA